MGKPAETDRRRLQSLNHSFTLDLVGVIGPKALAERLQEEIATFLWEELRVELNRAKTQVIHLPTEKARFLERVMYFDVLMLHWRYGTKTLPQ
jgi:hypothetical protein